MSKLAAIAPNQSEKAEAIQKKYKGIDIPEEIRADEAHLYHVGVIRSTPNADMTDFTHTLQIIKLTEQAIEVTKTHFGRFGGVTFILHDGQKWLEENEAKADNAKQPTADEILEAQKLEWEKEEAAKKKDALIEEQAAKIKAFEEREAKAAEEVKKAAEAGKDLKVNNETNVSEQAAKEEAAKKTNGKG